jgi:hypothetical protein
MTDFQDVAKSVVFAIPFGPLCSPACDDNALLVRREGHAPDQARQRIPGRWLNTTAPAPYSGLQRFRPAKRHGNAHVVPET